MFKEKINLLIKFQNYTFNFNIILYVIVYNVIILLRIDYLLRKNSSD